MIKDQKNMFSDDVSVVASGDIGDVLKLATPLNINQNRIVNLGLIYTETVAGGTGAGHQIELYGAGSDVSYDTVLATKTFASGSEPAAGDVFSIPLDECEDIQYLKIVATNTTGDYATGSLTSFLTPVH